MYQPNSTTLRVPIANINTVVAVGVLNLEIVSLLPTSSPVNSADSVLAIVNRAVNQKVGRTRFRG